MYIFSFVSGKTLQIGNLNYDMHKTLIIYWLMPVSVHYVARSDIFPQQTQFIATLIDVFCYYILLNVFHSLFLGRSAVHVTFLYLCG